MTTESLVNYTGSILIGGNTEIPWTEHLESLEVELVPGGAWTASMVLFDPRGDYIENLILSAGSNRVIDFSFGWEDPDEDIRREFSGFMLQYQPEFMPHGTSITLEIVARPAGMMVLDKQIRSFPEGLRASDIVRRIADANGWSTTDLLGRATIETTEPPLETPFNSKGESDLKFVRDQLLKQAVNGQGASGYIAMFDERGAFHFRTPDFLPTETHRYRFALDVAGDVIRFAPQDTSIFGIINGGGNARYTSAASAEGGTTERLVTAAGGIDNAGTPTVQDAAARPDLGDGTHSVVNLNVRHPAEVERTARARYETFRRHTYRALLEVHGTHRVRMTDYVLFEFVKPDGELHYLSGNFQVFGMKHSLGVGRSWTTEFDMTRPGIALQPGTEPLVASSTISPSEADPSDSSVGIPVES